MAPTRRYDALRHAPDLDIKAAITDHTDHRAYRSGEYFRLLTSEGTPVTS
jgi:hypothetical protein